MKTASRIYVFLVVALLLASCTSSPYQRQMALAQHAKFRALTITTKRGEIKAFTNRKLNASNSHIHIYLEGDGRPWENGETPASNPNSRDLLALRLMKQDNAPSIYLNRPCYGYANTPKYCEPSMWTSGRFSENVVETLNQAIDQLKTRFGVTHFWLIGHSGGGALAVLIAKRRQDVESVVTLAGNLDHQAWTQHHYYLPLETSLNPIDIFPLSSRVSRWHMFGEKDEVIPLETFETASSKDTGANIIIEKKFNHHCCWQKRWPFYLDIIQKHLTPI